MSDNGQQFPGSVQEVFDGIRDLIAKGSSGPVRILYVELGTPPQQPDAVDVAMPVAAPAVTSDATGGYAPEWNLQGHATIAYMARSILQRENQAAFDRLNAAVNADPSGRGDIGQLAMWPDRIKHPPPGATPDYARRGWLALGKKTQSMHFIDIPYRPGSRGEPQMPSLAGTVLEGLPHYVQTLTAWADAGSGVDALAFVIHFVGDIHQPLHCACLADDRFSPPDFDKGGNLVAWGASEKNPPSLHSLWDDLIASRPSDVFKQVEALLAKYPRSHFEHDASQDLKDWALDSHALARKAYDRFLAESKYDASTKRFTAPSKEYRKWAQEVALERAALAAYRLADTLANALPALDAIRGSLDGAHANGHRKNGASDANGATNGHHKNGANGHAASTTRKRKPRRRTHVTG
jgi:hypothetical protein